MKFNFIQNKEIFTIKLIAIVYITILYIMSGYFVTKYSDKYIMSKFVDRNIIIENNKNKLIIMIGIFAYIIRNILTEIPFPLNNKFGFNYSKVKELNSSALIIWSLLVFSPILNNKISLLRKTII